MLFLKQSNFIGLHSTKRITSLSFNKRMTILTGYNGTGKTSVLHGIYQTIDNMDKSTNSKSFLSPRSDWGIDLKITDNKFSENYKNEIRALQLTMPKLDLLIQLRYLVFKRYDFREVKNITIREPFTQDLIEFYSTLEKELSSPNKSVNSTSVFTTDKRKEDSTELFALQVSVPPFNHPSLVQVLDKYRRELEANNKLSAIFYVNESLYDSKKLSNEEIFNELDVFSKNNNLDKSIYILLNELRGQVFTKEDDLSAFILEKFLKLKSLNNEDINEIQLKADLSNIINEKKFTKDALNLIQVIDSFFAQIGKKAHIGHDGLIYFTENKNIIRWYDCSKGEKNLICLLLIVFLNKDNNTIFIFDEPDLAMHIEWQSKLLSTFLELAPKSQFIISTHSPALIPKDIEDIGFINLSKIKKEVESKIG